MNKSLLTFIFLVFSAGLFAQSPNAFNYQAALRDNQGALLNNQSVGLKIEIENSSGVVYSEESVVQTNAFGIINVQVGVNPSSSSNTFADIDWGQGPYSLKTYVDPNGGQSYQFNSSSDILSVPYAKYAERAENAFSGDFSDLIGVPNLDTSSSNELQSISLIGDTISLSQGGGSYIISTFSGDFNDLINVPTIDTSSSNELQLLSLIGDTISLSQGGGSYIISTFSGDFNDLTNVPTIDTSSSNEFQFLSTAGDTLMLSNGGFAILPLSTKAEKLDDLSDARTVNNSIGIGEFAINSLDSNSFFNTAVGVNAMSSNVFGQSNTALGKSALEKSESSWNTAVGHNALNNLVNGQANDALGAQAAFNLVHGSQNVAIGSSSLLNLGTDTASSEQYRNTALGAASLNRLVSGNNNIGIGNEAGAWITSGSNNVIIGGVDYPNSETHRSISNNVIVGNAAAQLISNNSNNNTILGTLAGGSVRNSNNTLLGYLADVNDSSTNNSIAIGYNSVVNSSNSIQLGNSNIIKVNTSGSYFGLGGNFTDSTTTGGAIVSMNSNTKGFLPPRMTQAERDLITSPSAGLVIYCTDCGTGEIQSYNGTSWSSSLFSNTIAEPSVRTNSATIASNYQVVISGVVLTDGGANLIRKGFVRSTNPAFATADTVVVAGGIGLYASDTIAPLFNTTYYYKAFAENQVGQAFGYTSSYYLPDTSAATSSSVVTLDSISNVGTQSATLYGEVVSANGTVVERGFVLDTLPQPTIDDILVSGGTQLGTYNEVKNGLTSNGKTYYVRSYLLTSNDTTYSNQLSFTTGASSSFLSVGQTYQGGIIFYLADDGQSGLIVTAANIGTAQYGCSGTEIGGTSKGLWSGKQNSDRILSACSDANTAAAMCANYVYQGYDDWYLPSWDELIVMRQNLHNNGVGNFNWWIWSSSEVDANTANSHDMSCGAYLSKSSQGGVRAVRTFNLGTSSTSAPTVAITGTSSNSFNSISVAGTIGGAEANKVYETGVVYSSTNATPTTSDNIQSLSEYAPYNCGPTINTNTYEGTSFLGIVQGLSSNTTYYMRAYAKTPIGTYYSSVVTVSTDSLYLASGNGVTDIDGNTYTSIIVGNMEWTVENLRVSKFNNGDVIPYVANGSSWSGTSTSAFTYYASDPTYNLIYGKWYNWYAIDDSRGLCPTGWHVATNQEWLDLQTALGGPTLAGDILKSTSSNWNNTNTGTNDIGFNAEPSGYVHANGNGQLLFESAFSWTSTASNSNSAYYKQMNRTQSNLYTYQFDKKSAAPCRCVKD